MTEEHLLTIDDETYWQTVLPASRNVFGSIEYARILGQYTNYQAQLLVFQSDSDAVAYPFLLRPVAELPFADNNFDYLRDTLTPEFTGPIALTNQASVSDTAFLDRYTRYCREQQIVAEFAHLHPWAMQPSLLDPSSVTTDREIVFVDTSLTETQLWERSFNHSCRKNIKRAQREGVQAFEATEAGDIKEFYRIYTQTMDRNQATGRYYFPLDYFMAFFEYLSANARFVLAAYRDQVVAATLYLHDDANVYSYLGGADHAFQEIRPTNAIIYDTICWAQQHEKQRLILGGGYRADDGIFRFKSSFSSLRASFRVYRRIHMPGEYAALCDAWSAYYGCPLQSSDYFPAYRSVPDISQTDVESVAEPTASA
jgi:serine/alanine adding enzyme